MKRDSFLILLGLLTAISPFVGIPLSWLLYILPIIGLLVIIIGMSFRKERRSHETPVQHESIPAQTVAQ